MSRRRLARAAKDEKKYAAGGAEFDADEFRRVLTGSQDERD
jgi:hypothetical protein